MSLIRKLPPALVNQIAAGEVIERPASIVKELLENSIDADARRIEVAVEQGGRERIRVSDDGQGIAAEDLPLAVASHATSKLSEPDDLFRIRTLGFRGEALASIAAVSQLRLRSRQSSAASGAEIEVTGGEAGPCRVWGGPPGTTVEVRGLFFNTPARRKFLRTTQTEMGHIVEAFTRVALAYPHLHLALRHNDRLVYELPATERWRDRLQLFFGPELVENLIWVESEDGPTRLRGYVAAPSHSRPNPRWQYLFLNGRFIRDRSLSHALGEAYRGLLMTGRYPIAFLCLEMPPELVDVNVHPTKLEVRFQESGRLYHQVLATLRGRFLSSDLTARLKPVPSAGSAVGVVDSPSQEQFRRQVADWAISQLSVQEQSVSATGYGRQAPADLQVEFSQARGPEPDARSLKPDARSPTPEVRRPALDAATALKAFQVHNAYLVAETPEGIVVIDQHALHERVLYEQLRERVRDQQPESQRLLVPEVVDLSAEEVSVILEHRPVLARLGIEVEPFGGGTVLVKSYPAMLGRLPPHQLIRDLVDQLQSSRRPLEQRDLLDELLHLVACKAAIKAGQSLTPEEITALLHQRELAMDAHHCPHGRPTALVFTKEELDKQFKRT